MLRARKRRMMPPFKGRHVRRSAETVKPPGRVEKSSACPGFGGGS